MIMWYLDAADYGVCVMNTPDKTRMLWRTFGLTAMVRVMFITKILKKGKKLGIHAYG